MSKKNRNLFLRLLSCSMIIWFWAITLRTYTFLNNTRSCKIDWQEGKTNTQTASSAFSDIERRASGIDSTFPKKWGRAPRFFHLSRHSLLLSLSFPLADTTTSPAFSAQTRGTLLSFLFRILHSSMCVSASVCGSMWSKVGKCKKCKVWDKVCMCERDRFVWAFISICVQCACVHSCW